MKTFSLYGGLKREELYELLLKTPKTHIHIMKTFSLYGGLTREELYELLLKTPKTHIHILISLVF